MKNEVRWSYLGIVPYAETVELMQAIRTRIHQDQQPDQILLLQHNPVITRGLSEKGTEKGLVLPRPEIEQKGIRIIDTDRGGQTTFHGPGQLVGYCMLDLKRRNLKIREFVMEILDVLSLVLDSYGMESVKDEKEPGIFVSGEKIAFIGLNVKQNVTTHGFSLNVNNDLKYFDYIVPCGMETCQVTSMEEIDGNRFSIFDVYWRFITYFADHFGDELEEVVVEDFA